MPLSQVETQTLRSGGYQHVRPVVVYGLEQSGMEFYAAGKPGGIPEMLPLGENRIFVSHELLNILTPHELSAFIDFRKGQMNNEFWSWVGGAGGALMGAMMGLEWERYRNATINQLAAALRNIADQTDGRESRPTLLSRRNFLGTTGATLGVGALGAMAAKAGWDMKFAKDDLTDVTRIPELASALIKIEHWHQHRQQHQEMQQQELPRHERIAPSFDTGGDRSV